MHGCYFWPQLMPWRDFPEKFSLQNFASVRKFRWNHWLLIFFASHSVWYHRDLGQRRETESEVKTQNEVCLSCESITFCLYFFAPPTPQQFDKLSETEYRITLSSCRRTKKVIKTQLKLQMKCISIWLGKFILIKCFVVNCVFEYSL